MRKFVVVMIVVVACLAVACLCAWAAPPPGAGGGKIRLADTPPAPGPPPPGAPVMPPPPPGGIQPPMPGGPMPYAPGPAPCAAAALSLPPPHAGQNISQRLGLSEEQKTKLQAVLDKAPAKLDPLRKTSAQAVEELRKALFVSETSVSKLGQLHDAAREAEVALGKAEMGFWTEIRSILTPDQLRQLGEFMMRPGRRIGPGPGGPPPPPGGPGVQPGGPQPNRSW